MKVRRDEIRAVEREEEPKPVITVGRQEAMELTPDFPTAEEVTAVNRLEADRQVLEFNRDYLNKRRMEVAEGVRQGMPPMKKHSPECNARIEIRSADGKDRIVGKLISRLSLHRYMAEWERFGVRRRGVVFYRGGELAEELPMKVAAEMAEGWKRNGGNA
ncbi:MAG: hypothetical protein AB1552_14055 [Nitrospirota bacterium]